MHKGARSILAYRFLFVILLVASLFLASAVIAYNAGDSDLTINYEMADMAGKHYFNDSRVYLSVEPLLKEESGEIILEAISKIYEGDVDVVFGFNSTDAQPRYASINIPHCWNVTQGYTCESDNYSYTAHHLICSYYNNETDTTFVEEYDFEWGSIPDKSVYWNISVCSDYRNFPPDGSIRHNYGGMDTWYYVKDKYMEKDRLYKMKVWLDIMPGKSGKYWFCLKPSDLTIQEAISTDRFYCYDPFFSGYSGWGYRKQQNMTRANKTIDDAVIDVMIDTATIISDGHIHSDCRDVRFTWVNDTDDAEYAVTYWIVDAYGCDKSNTWFKVRIPRLVENTIPRLYIYYNKSDATAASDIEQVCKIGDDFNDNSVNTTKWTTSAGSGDWHETGGKFIINNTDTQQPVQVCTPSSSLVENITMEYVATLIAGGGDVGTVTNPRRNNVDSKLERVNMQSASNSYWYDGEVGGSVTFTSDTNDDVITKAYLNGSYVWSNVTNLNDSNMAYSNDTTAIVVTTRHCLGSWRSNAKAQYNWVCISPFIGPENISQTSDIGSEESNPGPEIIDVTITPSPAYTDSILNCSGIYLGSSNGKVDITWYNGSAFYAIASKLDVSNGSMVSTALESIQAVQDGFETDTFGSDFPIAITTNGSDFWIADYNDAFVYHVNRTGGNISDGFKTSTFGASTPQGITTNGTALWLTDSDDDFVYHVDKSGYNFSDGFKIGSYILGITTNGSDFWVVDEDADKIYHTKPDGTGGTTNYSDSFGTTGFGSDSPYDVEVRGSDLWVYDMTDKFIYHVKPDGSGGTQNYSDGISISQTDPFRAITLWPVSYDTSNLSSLTDLWITDTFVSLVAHKKKVVADVAKGETWNCTMNAVDAFGRQSKPNSTTITISNTPPLIGPVSISNFNNCSAIAYDLDLDSLTLNFTWYKDSVYNTSSTKSSSNGTLASHALPEGTQEGGEIWNCSVFANDGTDDSALNSTTVTVGNNITFNVSDSGDDSQLSNFDIYCNNSWSVASVSSPYSHYFSLGSYSCRFERRPDFYNETINFTADGDKTVNVEMSRELSLTIEEHNWLEALYECIINGDCEAFTLWKNTNQTVFDMWKRITRTNREVVTQEEFISSTLSSSSNITLNYTIQIPFKQGYANGTLLPLRMYFWITNISKTQCYNQDKRTGSQNRAENLYCFPLIAETLGPNNGSVTFIVDLRPNLTDGTYNVTRAIEIDPIIDGLTQWTNYGQEDIGQISVEELNEEPEINLVKTGESSSVTSLAGMTGAVIQDIKSFLTNTDVLALAGMIIIGFIISLAIICLTIYKIKKPR